MQAQAIPVTTGIHSKHVIEIKPRNDSPIVDWKNARVITLGQHLIKDGSQIRIPSDASTTSDNTPSGVAQP